VVAIISVLAGMLVPSVSAWSSTGGRRSAVTTLMNIFEQARVAALEAGRPVYVVFWRRQFPEHDAVMVLRGPQESGGPYEQLTRWIKLPRGVLLHQPMAGQSMLSKSGSGHQLGRLGDNQTNLPKPLRDAIAEPGGQLDYMEFNGFGGVAHPNRPGALKLILTEGVRGTGGTEALFSAQNQSFAGFEIISLSRFTGRSQLDVSTVTN